MSKVVSFNYGGAILSRSTRVSPDITNRLRDIGRSVIGGLQERFSGSTCIPPHISVFVKVANNGHRAAGAHPFLDTVGVMEHVVLGELPDEAALKWIFVQQISRLALAVKSAGLKYGSGPLAPKYLDRRTELLDRALLSDNPGSVIKEFSPWPCINDFPVFLGHRNAYVPDSPLEVGRAMRGYFKRYASSCSSERYSPSIGFHDLPEIRNLGSEDTLVFGFLLGYLLNTSYMRIKNVPEMVQVLGILVGQDMTGLSPEDVSSIFPFLPSSLVDMSNEIIVNNALPNPAQRLFSDDLSYRELKELYSELHLFRFVKD